MRLSTFFDFDGFQPVYGLEVERAAHARYRWMLPILLDVEDRPVPLVRGPGRDRWFHELPGVDALIETTVLEKQGGALIRGTSSTGGCGP